MEVYLIRHTTPQVEKGVIYGQLDLDVGGDFQEESDQIIQQLPSHFDACYSSPLQRCAKLAFKLCPSFFVDERLVEYNFGDWEGQTWDNIDQRQLNQWMENYASIAPPNGETALEMRTRLIEFWNELIAKPYSSVAIITHAGAIRMLYTILHSLEIQQAFDLDMAYSTIFKITTTDNSFERMG